MAAGSATMLTGMHVSPFTTSPLGCCWPANFLLAGLARCSSAVDLLVEAESFARPGGWQIDCQFTQIMGSPYLLAHGLGHPVATASTEVRFPVAGTYRVWVRSKDWAPPHGPGRFRVVLDGRQLDPVFGASGDHWSWQDAGLVELQDKAITIELLDLTGFDGRCDAIYFTTDRDSAPTESPDEEMAIWRRSRLGLPNTPPVVGKFDLVVVGGGLAGCCAAVTAAKLGIDVALIQERPVLGGMRAVRSESIRRVWGRSVVDEIAGPHRKQVVEGQQRLQLFINWQATGVQMERDRIVNIVAKHTSSGTERRFIAPLFADCTGDAWIGYWAGAKYRMGREGRDDFDESLALPKPDNMTHGATLFFRVAQQAKSVPFPDVPWATEISKDHIDLRSDHSWEYGHRLDMIRDAEHIRDHLLRAIYGTFATVKQRFPQAAANVALTRVGYVAARGESRRLMGDYILTENDIRSQRSFPDGVARGGLVLLFALSQ